MQLSFVSCRYQRHVFHYRILLNEEKRLHIKVWSVHCENVAMCVCRDIIVVMR